MKFYPNSERKISVAGSDKIIYAAPLFNRAGWLELDYHQFQRDSDETPEPTGMIKMVDTAFADPQWVQIADNISRLKSELGAAANFFTPDLSVVTRAVPNYNWQAIATHGGLSIAIAVGTNQYITSTDNFATNTLRTLPITVRSSGTNLAQICVNNNGVFMVLLSDDAVTNTWRKYLTADGVNWTNQENWITGGSGSHDFAGGALIDCDGDLFFRLRTYAITSTIRGFMLDSSVNGFTWNTVHKVQISPANNTPSSLSCSVNDAYWVSQLDSSDEYRLFKNKDIIFARGHSFSTRKSIGLNNRKNMICILNQIYYYSFTSSQYVSVPRNMSFIGETVGISPVPESFPTTSNATNVLQFMCNNRKVALNCDNLSTANRLATHPSHWHLSSSADTRLNLDSGAALFAARDISDFNAIGKVNNTQFKHIIESPTHVITSVPYWVNLPAGKKWVVKIN